MFKRISAVLLTAVMFSLILSTSGIEAKTMYWRLDDPGTNAPPGNGWNEPPPSAPAVGGKIWLAMTNSYRQQNTKSFHFNLNLPEGWDFDLVSATGYYNSGNSQSVSTTRKERNGNTVTFHATARPQPAWEVLELVRTAKGGDGPFAITGSGSSHCYKTTESGGSITFEDNTEENTEDTVHVTEIIVFPSNSSVDETITPTIIAPPGSGTWTYDIVYVDPAGVEQPQGGVRFSTFGPGIGAWEEYDIQFAVEGSTKDTYWYWVYDTHDGEYRKFWVPVPSVIPTLSEWGMIIFCVLLFAWMAWMVVRRRKTMEVGI